MSALLAREPAAEQAPAATEKEGIFVMIEAGVTFEATQLETSAGRLSVVKERNSTTTPLLYKLMKSNARIFVDVRYVRHGRTVRMRMTDAAVVEISGQSPEAGEHPGHGQEPDPERERVTFRGKLETQSTAEEGGGRDDWAG